MYLKKCIALVTAAALSMSLTACAGKSGGTQATQVPSSKDEASGTEGGAESGTKGQSETMDSEFTDAIQKVLVDKEDVSISFWTSTSQRNYPYLEAMIKAFETEYPNIKVDLSHQGAVSDLMDKLTQNIVSRTTPTLSNLNPAYFPEYIDSGALIDLMPYYEDSKLGFSNEEKEAFYPFYIEEALSFSESGTMYGFPTNKKTSDIFFYNKTYFDEQGWDAPETWDEVADYSKQIKEDTGMPGFSYDVAYAEAAFKVLSMQWGSPYLNQDGSPEIGNDASREVMAFYKDNFDAGYFTMPSEMPSAGGNYSNSGFVVGECYMFVGAAAGTPYSIPKEESGHTMFEVGLAPIPQKDSANRIAFSKGEDYCIFSNATEEEKVAAWLLVKFLSRDDQNVEWLIHTGNLPITSTILEIPEYKQFLETPGDGSEDYYKAAAVKAALGMSDYMSFELVSADSSTLASDCGAMWKSVIIGGEDIEQALGKITR